MARRRSATHPLPRPVPTAAGSPRTRPSGVVVASRRDRHGSVNETAAEPTCTLAAVTDAVDDSTRSSRNENVATPDPSVVVRSRIVRPRPVAEAATRAPTTASWAASRTVTVTMTPVPPTAAVGCAVATVDCPADGVAMSSASGAVATRWSTESEMATCAVPTAGGLVTPTASTVTRSTALTGWAMVSTTTFLMGWCAASIGHATPLGAPEPAVEDTSQLLGSTVGRTVPGGPVTVIVAPAG